MKKIKIPDDPTQAATAIVAYAGIALRLHSELAKSAEASGIDLGAIRDDLLREAKRAVPHGDFAKDEIATYKTMFEAIETIFDTVY